MTARIASWGYLVTFKWKLQKKNCKELGKYKNLHKCKAYHHYHLWRAKRCSVPKSLKINDLDCISYCFNKCVSYLLVVRDSNYMERARSPFGHKFRTMNSSALFFCALCLGLEPMVTRKHECALRSISALTGSKSKATQFLLQTSSEAFAWFARF